MVKFSIECEDCEFRITDLTSQEVVDAKNTHVLETGHKTTYLIANFGDW